MKVVDDPERIMPVHERLQSVVDRVEGRAVAMEALERFDSYATRQACLCGRPYLGSGALWLLYPAQGRRLKTAVAGASAAFYSRRAGQG
jgi:hypothetical protein